MLKWVSYPIVAYFQNLTSTWTLFCKCSILLIQLYFGDTVGSFPEHHNKADVTIESHDFFAVPVHCIKFMLMLYVIC